VRLRSSFGIVAQAWQHRAAIWGVLRKYAAADPSNVTDARVEALLEPVTDVALPASLQHLAEQLSCDGQLYRRCSACGLEQRLPWQFGLAAPAAKTLRCRRCGTARWRPVVHLTEARLQCGDCQHATLVTTNCTTRPSCPRCGSARLTLAYLRVSPPFSRTFADASSPLTFGQDGDADGVQIVRETQAIAAHPDHAALVVLLGRLCRRLQLYSYEEDETVQIQFVSPAWQTIPQPPQFLASVSKFLSTLQNARVPPRSPRSSNSGGHRTRCSLQRVGRGRLPLRAA
jgi:hypothetical protein